MQSVNINMSKLLNVAMSKGAIPANLKILNLCYDCIKVKLNMPSHIAVK